MAQRAQKLSEKALVGEKKERVSGGGGPPATSWQPVQHKARQTVGLPACCLASLALVGWRLPSCLLLYSQFCFASHTYKVAGEETKAMANECL